MGAISLTNFSKVWYTHSAWKEISFYHHSCYRQGCRSDE